MKKETLLTILVVMLLLLNLGVLTYLFIGQHRPPGPPPGGPGNGHVDRMIKETLHLTDEQVKLFEQSRNNHHAKMMELNDRSQQVLNSYFGLLRQGNTNPAAKDSLENVFGQLQAQKAQFTYKHFEEIKALCTPEQEKAFETILPEIMEVISQPGKGGPPPPRP